MVQFDFVQELKKGPSYEHCVICTYEFGPEFFERYALQRFKAFSESESITVLIDSGVYQALCESGGYRPSDANRLYLLQDVPSGATFHPKVILLASPTRGKLVVGSANFTKPGLTTNAELAAVLTFTPEDRSHQATFAAAYGFLLECARTAPDSTFSSNLAEMGRCARWLMPAGEVTPFIHNRTHPLLDTMLAVAGDSQISEYLTLSPYFDADLGALDEIARRLTPHRITIITQQDTTTLAPSALSALIHRYPTVAFTVKLIEFPREERHRVLHGKLHLLRTSGQAVCLMGSPNCTAAALLGTSATGNTETGLLFQGAQVPEIERLLAPPGVRLRTVKNPADIRHAARPPRTALSFPIALTEAVYEGEGLLRLSVEVTGTIPDGSIVLDCRGVLRDQEQTHTLALPSKLSPSLSVLLPPSHAKLRALIEVTAVRLRFSTGDDWSHALSRWRWVENIRLDGRAIRIARAIRNATENASKFYELLTALTARDDVGALVEFLLYCNIPIEGASRSSFPAGRPPASGLQPGPRTLKAAADLRQALHVFFERHLRKLRRHVQHPSPAGVPSFVHIFEIVVKAAAYHWNYELSLLRDGRILSVDSWGTFRDQTNRLFVRWSALIDLLAQLAERLRARTGRRQARPPQNFGDVAAAAIGAAREFFDEANRTAQWLLGTCTVRRSDGILVKLPFGPGDFLDPDSWPGYRSSVLGMLVNAAASKNGGK